MDDLVTWLRARLNEREALLLHTQASKTPCPVPIPTLLAEVDAKRRILDAYEQREQESLHPSGKVFGYHATGLLIAIKLLALPFAERAGYQESWRP
jgi:hypothetical protein